MILPWQKQKWWQISRKCRLSFLDFSRLFCRNSFIQSYKCKYFLYTFNILPNIFVYQIKVNIGWIRCLWIFLLINIDPKVSIIFMIKLCFFMLQSTCSVVSIVFHQMKTKFMLSSSGQRYLLLTAIFLIHLSFNIQHY